MPQVSAIVPARDVGSYITPLLKDLERQTFADLEVIVVDDGSTDGTLQVIEGFAERNDRFRLLTSGGAGVSTARNVGIDSATGEFLAFVDADDRVESGYVQALHDSISASGSDLVSCNVLRLEGFQTSPSILHRRACAKPAVGTHLSRSPHLVYDTTVWNKLWRREMWDRAGIRYAEGRWLNDFYPSIRGHVAARAVDIIPDVLYYWRVRTDPTTSITDSRLTDPTARLKSFDDRTFAIRSARRMVADELPVQQVLHSFDQRILRSDLPIYLPYYVGSDQAYRDLLVERIGQFLTEFGVRPRQFQLGNQLQLVYRAILSRDHAQLEALLHPDTQVHPSQVRRQRTELVLAATSPAPNPAPNPATNPAPAPATSVRRPTTPHGLLSRRLAMLARATGLRRLDTPPISADAHIDRVGVDPSRPTTLVVHGAVRLREGRSGIAGAWTVSACLESTRKMRGTGRLPKRVGRAANKVIQRVRGPRARIVGPPSKLEPPPDAILHPLTRSGWQPFTAKLDLAETVRHRDDREWRLAVHLQAGRMDLYRTAKVTKDAARCLPGGFQAGAKTDLVPAVDAAGRLTLRREPVRGQMLYAAVGDGDLALEVRFPGRDASGTDPSGTDPNGTDPSGTDRAAALWLQTVDRQLRGREVKATGTKVMLPLPELTGEATKFELWCRTSQGTGRVRAHPTLRTVRVTRPGADRRTEAVLRPTANGRVVFEVRPPQLDLSWMRADDSDDAASFLLIGGEGVPQDLSRSPLVLVMACSWSGERMEAPIKGQPDGWHAAVDIDLLARDTDGQSRSWSLLMTKGSGSTVPLRIPAEQRVLLPMQENVNGQPVQLRVGDSGEPVLWIGPDQEHSRWRQLRKVQRSKAAVTVPAAADGDSDQELAAAGENGPPSDRRRSGIEDLAAEAVLRRLTAPQASRSMTMVGQPSFREKVDERVRRRRYLLRYTDTIPVTEPLIRKPQRDRILSMLGLPLPTKLLDSGDLTDVFKLLQDHEEAVVKPVSGANGKGVYLLRRSGNAWQSLRSGTELSAEELRAKLEAITSKGKPVPRWQVEQLVAGDSGQPMDVKFYMFQGRHGLAVRMKRLPDRTVYRFFDPSWQAIDVGRDEEKTDHTLSAPENPGPLLDLAVRVSQALPLPFIRVDLLLGRDGLYVGEVTPMPGRYHRFSETVDRELGLLWEMAEFHYSAQFLTAERFRAALDAIREVTGTDRLYPD